MRGPRSGMERGTTRLNYMRGPRSDVERGAAVGSRAWSGTLAGPRQTPAPIYQAFHVFSTVLRRYPTRSYLCGSENPRPRRVIDALDWA